MSPDSTSGFRAGKLHSGPKRWEERVCDFKRGRWETAVWMAESRGQHKLFSFHNRFTTGRTLRHQQSRQAVLCSNKGKKSVYFTTLLSSTATVSDAGRNLIWQQSLCHLSLCSFRENILLPRATSDPPAHSVSTILPLFLTRGGSCSFQPHYCENNPASNTLSLWLTDM